MRIILSILVLSFAAQAQDNLFRVTSLESNANRGSLNVTYKGDVTVEGTTYSNFQTQAGDNVLIPKKKKERRRYPGTFLFSDMARHYLTEEGFLTFGLSLGYRSMSAQTAEDQTDVARTERGLDSTWTPVVGDPHTSAPNMGVSLSYRPNFYRHLRLGGRAELLTRGDQKNNVTNGLEGYVLTVDHDIIVLPSYDGYFAISAGYFAARHYLNYNFTQDGSVVKSATLPLTDKGVAVNFRYLITDSSGPDFGLEATAELGKGFGRQYQLKATVAFGGR